MRFYMQSESKKIIPKSNEKYWVVSGNSDEIRPYRLLIKKIKDS